MLCDSTYHVQNAYFVLDISCTGDNTAYNLPGREVLLLNPAQETDAQNILQLAQSHTLVNGKSAHTHKEHSKIYLTIGVNDKDSGLGHILYDYLWPSTEKEPYYLNCLLRDDYFKPPSPLTPRHMPVSWLFQGEN